MCYCDLNKRRFYSAKVQKIGKGVNFEFFSFKIDDSLVPKEIKEIIEPNRDQLIIAEKEIDHKKNK